MKIGIEASSLITPNPSGIAKYITELINALLPNFYKEDELCLLYKMTRSREKKKWWRMPEIKAKGYYKSLWPILKDVDLVHLPDSTRLEWRKIRRVITIHDLLVLISEDDHVAPKKFRDKKRKIYENIIGQADAILAISNTTKRDVCRLFNVPERKIHVTHLGIDHRVDSVCDADGPIVMNHYGLEPGYLLFLGAISGRKNTDRLVRGFARSAAVKERMLVLAGPLSYKSELTLAAIKDEHLGHKVKILGYVPDEHVAALYQGAGAFVFPTLYEGFGFPILEAMSYGIPVLTSSVGAAPEISAGHAHCVDPLNVDAIAKGIDHVLEMDAEERENARRHSRQYTWARCAEKTLEVYRATI